MILREISATRQRRGEPRRRWFYSPEFELVVWLGEGDAVVGFQLSYDKDTRPHALTWRHAHHFTHAAIDTGETHPLRPKATPILLANGYFNATRVAENFQASSTKVPRAYVELVTTKIHEYGATATP